jgi:hypothetical protein
MRNNDLLRTNVSPNYGSLHEQEDLTSDGSWSRGKSVSMLVDDEDVSSFTSRVNESCDADNCPGFCMCECDVMCSPPCCTVRRPLRCAAIVFLLLSLLEAVGIFSVGLAVATTEWTNATPNGTVSNETSNRATTLGSFVLEPTLINQACSNAIMSMYASACFAVFSVQSIRDESKIQLASACSFSLLVVLFVALHLESNRFGHIWKEARLPALIASSVCTVGVLLLAIPVSTTFGWVAYKTLRNADPVTLSVFQRFNNWQDTASMDFALWVLIVLAGGAFDVGFDVILSSAALGTSLLWWRMGSAAARYQWSKIFSHVYLPLSVCLPCYAGYVSWKFYGAGALLPGLRPDNFMVLVGMGVAMRIVLFIVGCKMRFHEDWIQTRDVLMNV